MSESARIRALFDEVVDLAGHDREARLRAHCAGDLALFARVEALLAAAEREDGFLAAPTVAESSAAIPLNERPGTFIGRYRLLEQIGEGGFGVVFLAEQREPVVRKVALKIIKLGMDTRQVIARFEAERQALAMMDHPNIARVLDAAETETGRPYFVMELVRGDPITAYCNRNNVSTRDRLDLFTRVCHAVQHAHQKGVIHRDIKPSNVLITVADGKPIPKVIDFGIAKATASKLTEKTLFTEHRALIGTPAYMSPEQAEMSGVDIDTRSDIYSLGVLLYELLTGTTPFDTGSLMAAGLAEIQRIIREVEPEKPSTRLSTLQGTLPKVASERRTEPERLSALVRGDLDWIVMKALEKDRTRRYETASGLAADVARHLAGEPVSAAPPSAAYRVRKFARRHKVGVAAGSLVGVALILGVVGTSLGMAWALRERGRAAAEAARAERSAEVAQAVTDFLNRDVLRAILPVGERVAARGKDVKLREVLAEAARRLDAASAPGGRLGNKPMVEAAIRLALADAFVSLGEPDAAEPHVLRGRDLTLAEYGEADGRSLRAELSVAGVRIEQGRLEESATELRALLARSERDPALDEELASEVRGTLAHACWRLGQLTEAEALTGRVVEYYTRANGGDHPSTLGATNGLAEVYRAQRRLTEAETLFRRITEITERSQGRTHPNSLRYIGNLAAVLFDQARYDEAEVVLRDIVERFREVHGPTHPDTAQAMGNLATVLATKGDAAGAEPVHREVLEIFQRSLGAEHPRTLRAAIDLAPDLLDLGRPEEVATLLTPTLELLRRVLGVEHELTRMAMTNLAIAYDDLGRLDEAEKLKAETVEVCRRAQGPEHVLTLGAQTNLANLYWRMGRLEEARALLAETLAVKRRVLGIRHPFTRICMRTLAGVLEALGRSDEARSLREELAAWEAGRGEERTP